MVRGGSVPVKMKEIVLKVTFWSKARKTHLHLVVTSPSNSRNMAMLNIGDETPIKVLKSVFKSYDADKNGKLDKGTFYENMKMALHRKYGNTLSLKSQMNSTSY